MKAKRGTKEEEEGRKENLLPLFLFSFSH